MEKILELHVLTEAPTQHKSTPVVDVRTAPGVVDEGFHQTIPLALEVFSHADSRTKGLDGFLEESFGEGAMADVDQLSDRLDPVACFQEKLQTPLIELRTRRARIHEGARSSCPSAQPTAQP